MPLLADGKKARFFKPGFFYGADPLLGKLCLSALWPNGKLLLTAPAPVIL